MDIDVTVERVCGVAKAMKLESCKDSVSSDLKSFLVFEHGDEMVGLQSGLDGNPVENLPEALRLAYRSGVKRFDSLSFVTDVYFRERPVDGVGEYVRGDLAREFESNPFTDVVEALCVFTMSWSGESRVKVVQYKLDDVGHPVFFDPSETVVESGERIGGLVKAILDSYVTFCKVAPVQVFPEND